MSPYRWITSSHELAVCPQAQANPSLVAVCGLMWGTGSPVVGAVTLLFDDLALQFGVPDEASTRWLGQVHGDDEGWPAAAATSLPMPETCGFDLAHPTLGLTLESQRRHTLPVQRDRHPGEWQHPVLRVHTSAFFMRILAQRNLGLGESFLAAEFEMLRGSVHHFIGFFVVNRLDRHIKLPAAQQVKLFLQYARWRAAHSHNEDIADHYDIGDNIMVPMLGATGCYSCGYMEHETDSLDRMQQNKIDLIFSKLRLKPGMRVLDTGCGNGGMLVHAALSWGCIGEGFTNSFNMASLARRNAHSNGVGDKVTIHHGDFSLLAKYPDASFDAIYEVGVWEHLPFADYEEVMRQCQRILKPNGRMLIHSMGSHQKKHVRDGYIQKYIFRDSNQIRLHLLLDEARKHDLYVADVENIGRHYYWTLWYWRFNLLQAFEDDRSISERDFRVMLYFLECGMVEARFGDGSVYHLLLYKDARDHRHTWRVDARVRTAGHGAVQAAPFLMKPCNLNEHLHNDAHTEGKLAQAVYRKPAALRRLRQWLYTVTHVSHQ